VRNPNTTELPSNTVLAALKDAWPNYYQHDQKVECVLTCISFPEPESQDQKLHTGLHPSLFKNYVSMNVKFGDLLEFAHSVLEKRRAEGKTMCTFYCVDRLGRHGSCAMAKALAEIVLADESLTLGRVFLTANLWSIERGPCECCGFWTKKFRVKNEDVSAVLTQWRQVRTRQSLYVTVFHGCRLLCGCGVARR